MSSMGRRKETCTTIECWIRGQQSSEMEGLLGICKEFAKKLNNKIIKQTQYIYVRNKTKQKEIIIKLGAAQSKTITRVPAFGERRSLSTRI